MTLPQSVSEKVEFAAPEDILLPILRAELPDVSIQDRIWDDQAFPFVLIRRPTSGINYQGDPRFTDSFTLSVQTFAADPDGDRDASLLSEAVRVVLRDAATQRRGVPGLGYLIRVDMTLGPRRVSDWATASGPVQYADLPTACWRWEARYDVEIRKSNTRPYPPSIP